MADELLDASLAMVDDAATKGAEHSLVVACLMDPCRAMPLVEHVDPKHFADVSLGAVFAATRRVWRKRVVIDGAPMDMAHLTADLRAQRDGRGNYNAIGGAAYLGALLNDWRPTAQAETFARGVINGARKRALAVAAAQFRALALDPTVDADDAEARAFGVMRDIVIGTATRGMRSQREVTSELIDAVKSARLALRNGGSRAALSGWPTLDDMTGGAHGGELVVMAGRPGMGKTIAMENYAHNVASSQRRAALIFSEEMKAIEIINRRVAGDAGLTPRAVMMGAIDDGELAQIEDFALRGADLPIHWHDSASVTIEDIAAHARTTRHMVGDVGLVAIDYAQRLKRSRKDFDEKQHASHVATAAKTLARELDCPVILLSQLSRDLEKRGDKRPMMADLRDSGVLEQEADTILFLYRPWVYDKNADPRAAEIIIGKHRHAPCGHVEVVFDGARARFTDNGDHPAVTHASRRPGQWADPDEDLDDPSLRSRYSTEAA